jgi:uncharacterized membrane-anchored protein YitT (DUF2179 family)
MRTWLPLLNTALLIVIGSALQAVAIMVFLVPAQITPTGVSGVAVILNHLIDTPIGLITLIGNIPIQILAYRMLGGKRVILTTILSLLIFSFSADILAPLLTPVSENDLLNALFGGILEGIGAGLVYRAGGTVGGTATLALILQRRFGLSITSAVLYTDTGVIAAAGAIFGWEPALLAIVTLFVSGMASDYVLEGPSVIRTLIVITNRRDEVSEALLNELQRGVTAWDGTGMYTGQERAVLLVAVTRAQVNPAQQVIHRIDPAAFIIVGQGHIAYGEGFRAPITRVYNEKVWNEESTIETPGISS